VSLGRQLRWFWQSRILRRERLLADGLPLGMRLRVPARDDVGRRIYKYGIHEAPVFTWLDQRPAPGRDAIALDIGANLGWYAVLLDRLAAGRLAVHAFEPDPDNRALLEENLLLNDSDAVTVSELALADRAGEALLHRYRSINLGKHSLLPMEGAVDSVDVRTGTVDAYLASKGLDRRPIWLMKIDAEGVEPDVIRGAAASLDRVESLMLEYSPLFYSDGDGDSMLRTISASGLRPERWDGGAWRRTSVDELAALPGQHDTVWSRPPA
jgi:FkbM family methyltransferase